MRLPAPPPEDATAAFPAESTTRPSFAPPASASAGNAAIEAQTARPHGPRSSRGHSSMPLHRVLTHEGLRLFFPLAAVYAAIWPLAWVLLWSFQLPLSTLPPGLWHAQEMILGAWGAALLGFLTTAPAEWTDTPRPRGGALWALAALWAVGRLAGLLGSDWLQWPSAVADLSWMLLLVSYLGWASWQRRTTRLLAFVGWLLALTAAATIARAAMLADDAGLAAQAWRLTGLIFLGILGLALVRITVPITNLVLDPSQDTSPFRPHPGRLNLAPGLLALAVIAEVGGVSPTVGAYLWIAAGAAFMDRVAEAFVGREALRAEIVSLAVASALAGLGLLALGASRLGAPWGATAPLHISLMGGLGMGVLAVMALAGRLHTGRPLGLSWPTRLAFVLLVVAVAMRALPEMGLAPWPPGPPYALATLLWAAAFLLWLIDYWPAFSEAPLPHAQSCRR